MNNCVECGKELDENHVDPVPLCDDHWHLWWYIGMFMNEDGSVIDFSEHQKMYFSSSGTQEKKNYIDSPTCFCDLGLRLRYYDRIKNGERFKNWLDGNKVEKD